VIYGVVLNDRDERQALAQSFHESPHDRPPIAPVVYIKPRLCATTGGASVPVPRAADELVVAATIGLLFGRDATCVAANDAMKFVDAACLALEVSLPSPSYYRPAVAERCRDGFLPLGEFSSPRIPDAITTQIDGSDVHRWSLDRLVRSAGVLISDLSQFMTLCAGDVLLLGVAGDAPRARAGNSVRVVAHGLPSIETSLRKVEA
jgi:5-oxopent-3-ene-1,2,5-tricarboxylate decarboxylase/2-hydroxyhepta-2,4-diene-1,7-dioate isomerase